MSVAVWIRLALALCAALAGGAGVVAQQPVRETPAPVPGHRHYASPAFAQDQRSPEGAIAPRLQNLGSHTFPVTTRSPEAQRFINQGLNLSYAFNHAESGRAFREAARLDPDCAMAYWGQALVLGPNVNAAMDPADEPKALEAIQKASALKARASAREVALIDALAQRYSGKPADREARDRAYNAAMREAQRQFPDDLDIATLYVESLMDTRPWNYWTRDGLPHDRIAEAIALTERVIARNPAHPGALHLYIHLMEAQYPERAEQAADRLLPLVPAAGHMVHMPAHIYQRVGRYADAIRSNELAVAADEDYISQCRAQGLYPMGYYPHNVHFLWFAASADGQSRRALDAARKLASKIDDGTLAQMPMLAGFRVVPYYALTRFGRWDEMLNEPAPPSGNAFLTGVWQYSRGLAFVAKGQLDQADRALGELNRLMGDKSLDATLFSPNTARAILSIAPEVLSGEIAVARRQFDTAIAHLDRAVRLEDALVYTEPAEWHYPPRLALGAALLDAGRAAEAETVYWEDLKRNRESGWALFGLAQALRAQKKEADAQAAEARFRKAWARADVSLTASRLP